MVIDKWTRSFSNTNNNLAVPLLSHKAKETFSELKIGYERLKALNYRFKKWKKSPIQKGENAMIEIEFVDLKDYMDKINEILISIDELISEENNYELNEEKKFDVNKKNNIYNEICFECDNFIENMKTCKRDENINYNFNINSYFNKSRNLINNINQKLKKNKFVENIIFGEDQSNQSLININPNIDRGKINIFSSKREFNNSITFEQNSVQFTIEQESISNLFRLILFVLGICFLLFICYLCIY